MEFQVEKKDNLKYSKIFSKKSFWIVFGILYIYHIYTNYLLNKGIFVVEFIAYSISAFIETTVVFTIVWLILLIKSKLKKR